MSDKTILIYKCHEILSDAQRTAINGQLSIVADALDCKALVVDSGSDVGFASDNRPLIDAITEQTKAINRLANSNAMLADAISQEREGDEEEEPRSYMDGTPL